jgi:hypothetical protein
MAATFAQNAVNFNAGYLNGAQYVAGQAPPHEFVRNAGLRPGKFAFCRQHAGSEIGAS